jgi:hypothetical protein
MGLKPRGQQGHPVGVFASTLIWWLSLPFPSVEPMTWLRTGVLPSKLVP